MTTTLERTMPLRVELMRQLLRRRTQATFGFMAALPLLLLGAFGLGSGDTGDGSGGFLDLATSSGLNFVVFTLILSSSFLLVVVVALFFGDTVASEASWSSLKYLLAAPVPRGRLVRQKAIVAGLLSVLALAVLVVSALIVGVIAYGTGDLVSPTGEVLSFASASPRLAGVLGYLAVHLAWIAGLGLLLSVSTDAPLGAVGGAVLASILSQILDSVTALGDLREYLPTHYSMAWTDLLAVEIRWPNLAWGAFSGLAYAVIFVLPAMRRFSTKDITS